MKAEASPSAEVRKQHRRQGVPTVVESPDPAKMNVPLCYRVPERAESDNSKGDWRTCE